MQLLFEIVIVIFMSTRMSWIQAKCSKSLQVMRHHNEALAGHVIMTVQASYFDCVTKCGETNGCRSFNFYKDSHGQEMCDLNKSSKTLHPGSVIYNTGYEYDEITRRNNCTSHVCLGTAEGSWHDFNSSLFQLFKERLSWNQARKLCLSLQGDLASIASQEEKDFINKTLLSTAPRGNSTDIKLIGLWKLDGEDAEITLHGEAKIKNVDGYKALYLDGKSTNFATTPTFDIINRGFSIGAWIKLLTPTSRGVVYGDWSSPYQFAVEVDERGTITFQLNFQSNFIIKLQYSSIPFNTWVHVMASWRSNARTMQIRINGKQEMVYTVPSNVSGVNLMYTGHGHDIGLERNQSTVLHGYIRELAVYSWPADSDGRAFNRIGRWDKYDGVWIGLNDMTSEGTFAYSDGSAMTYTNWEQDEPDDRHKFEDCVAVSLSDASRPWVDKACGMELPFICRKKE